MSLVLDRPYVQHVIEQLVTRAVSRIEIFLRTHDSAVEALLGDGTRWGTKIVCRRLPGLPAEGDFAEACKGEEGDGLVLLGDLCYLPAIPALDTTGATAVWPTLFFHDDDKRSRWTGWALVPARQLAGFACQVAGEADWRSAMSYCGLQLRKQFLDGPSLSASSPGRVLESNRIALDGRYPGLYFEAMEREPGIWVGRGVRIPPAAALTAPCYIGEDSWIGRGCRIGPYAVVGRGCAIEKGTVVSGSVVGEETYLGPELEIADSVVHRSLIHNVRLGAEVEIEEAHVASSLTSGSLVPQWLKLAAISLVLPAVAVLAWML